MTYDYHAGKHCYTNCCSCHSLDFSPVDLRETSKVEKCGRVPGRAIEPGGLYAGREQELDKINKMLFGQTHEKLGNLVGWVY
jgi:hypothetical protein